MARNSKNQRRAQTATKKKKSRKTKRKSGRKALMRPGVAYEPSSDNREIVLVMAAHGIPQTEIGLAIKPPCDAKTLRKHFAEELAGAGERYKYHVAAACTMHLFGRPAVYDGKGRVLQEEVKPDRSMAIFMSKVKLRYSDRPEQGQGMMLTPEMARGLTDKELQTIVDLMEKAAISQAQLLPPPDEDDSVESAKRYSKATEH